MMRLRKFELAFVAITLAFLFFIGGFFTGRNFNQVNIDSFDSLRVETSVFQTDDVGSLPANDTMGEIDSGSSTDTDSDNAIVGNSQSNSAETNQSDAARSDDVPPGMPRGGDGRININTASKNELMDLPGIGPSLADSIIEYRNANGAFAAIEDIMNVSGIAEGRFARIRERITV